MNKLIEVNDLAVKYGKNPILKSVNFSVCQGDYIGIVGPNGAGKTTLIKALLGLHPLDQGRITYYPNRASLRIGYLPQVILSNDHLFPAKVSEVVGLGLIGEKKYPKRLTKDDRKRVNDMLERLGISEYKNRKIGDLSGGQQQRVYLARALVNHPHILILDEPTSALDPQIREDFFKIIEEIHTIDQTAMMLISHDTHAIESHAKKMMLIERNTITLKNIGGATHDVTSG